jgi:transposase
MSHVVFRLWQGGQPAAQIAASVGVPLSTVYRLIERFRRDGAAGIAPSYARPAPGHAPSDLEKAALELRREHPTWGAGWVRVQLLDEEPGRAVPTDRTLRRLFARADLAPARAGRRPKGGAWRAASPHDTWQIDAKEHMKPKNLKEVSRLRIIDECSGGVLHTTVFPPRGVVEGRPS